MHVTLEKQKYKKPTFSSIWMPHSSFKLLINWAIIMMCLWGWKRRNNLQVGEMKHECLPSLTCAVLLVCVRSRQIPSVLSAFASGMGGWELQLPPLLLWGTRFLNTRLLFHRGTRSPRGPFLWGSRLGSCDIYFNSQVPPTEQDMARQPPPLQGRKGAKQFRWYLCCTEQSGSGISDLALKYQLTSEE